MARAFTLAESAYTNGDVPVGCVIVRDGEIIAEGFNSTRESHCVTRHAEIEAIENACKALKSQTLTGCELYVTLEPCPMCAGAIINAKVGKVVFGAYDTNYGACGSAFNLFSIDNIPQIECYGGIMEEACSDILSRFFKDLRDKK